ncbi:TPA: hypothetical protein HA251_02240 [Candidatus Woesearchaeota archaeon]|nr:hypothetical protein [Candidatus Woesearchaeota archaeon]
MKKQHEEKAKKGRKSKQGMKQDKEQIENPIIKQRSPNRRENFTIKVRVHPEYAVY